MLGALALGLLGLPAVSATDFAFSPAIEFADITRMQLLDITVAGERLVAVGERGLIMVSDDDGASWQQAKVPISATLAAVSFPTATLGWAVGHSGIILHSTDGGSNWQLQFDGNAAAKGYAQYALENMERLQQAFDLLESTAEVGSVELGDLEYALEDAIFAEEDARAA